MIGAVNERLEATLRLQIYGSPRHTNVTAVVDTGFNGSLSLPNHVIVELSLALLSSRPVTLGDGTQRVLDFYQAEVVWDNQRQAITVMSMEGDPLIGTGLLQQHRLQADFVIGASVRIDPISSGTPTVA